ncbi:MAG: hypothetical protein QM817_26125 [Archangium sp.]
MAVLAAEKPKLAVLDVAAVGVDQAQASALGNAMAAELDRRGFFEIISANDIRTLLGVERQKELLGCGDSNCTAELSGAIGARFVLQATLTKLGNSMQLSIQMLDTSKAQAVARSLRLAKDTRQLVSLLPWALAEATATPMPPAPSKVLPWTLIAAGATLFAGGGVVAIDGFSRDRALRSELRDTSVVYQSYQHYSEEIEVITRNKWLGMGVGAVGAGLLLVGVLIFPKEPNASLALLPTTNGAVLVGSFP